MGYLIMILKAENVVGSKCMYWTKYHANGSLNMHKAKLVVSGFSHISGVHFTHMFSPVVKPSTIMVVISLTVINSCGLHQLDVNNTFLHDHLNEFIDPSAWYLADVPETTSQINKFTISGTFLSSKAIYRLKQAQGCSFIG